MDVRTLKEAQRLNGELEALSKRCGKLQAWREYLGNGSSTGLVVSLGACDDRIDVPKDVVDKVLTPIEQWHAAELARVRGAFEEL